MNIVITGGVGFIGTNAALFFSKKLGANITIIDNFSRFGVKSNAQALLAQIKNLTIIKSHVANTKKYLEALKQADVIIHLAGQTAVTTSITNPQLDFESNVVGTFSLLEAVRLHNPKAILLYSSTNKVYGNLEHHKMKLSKKDEQYINLDFPQGVGEDAPLHFISPYGCSKGAMDEYMEDYARIYGLRTIVFRQSCIYGQYQMGVEDQGWVAHFAKQILLKKPITIFGDGYQVRDLLYVEDLVEAYWRAIQKVDSVKGLSFNIGGGVHNTFSLRHVLKILQERTGNSVPLTFDTERAGDQKYFVSENALIKKKLAWQPTTKFLDGVNMMLDWQKVYFKA